MNNFMNYINENGSAIGKALLQHISLSFVSLMITMVIAIPLAIFLMRYPKVGEAVQQLAGVIQTLPSLAILGLLIPFVGIGTVPAVIALVLYAIMPIFSNTYAGLTGIDPELKEAAEAFGLSGPFKLFRIYLPLALPMILTGIRLAMVMIIGTATLAALIGGGGLGTYILLGIQTNNNNALLVGALLSAILALLASYLLKILSKLSFKKLGIGLVALLIILGGFYGWQAWSNSQSQTITIAGKMGGEPEILINMYKDVIEADDSHTEVKLKPNFGGTSFLFGALRSGKIDIYPEFTGTVLQSLVKGDGQVAHNPERAYQAARQSLNKQFNLDYLAPMAYQNGYALTVRASDAKQYQLKSIADLAKYPQFKAGFDPDFYQQKDGYPGLKEKYHLDFTNVKTMEPALRYEALNNGQLDVTDAYTTDPQIKQYHLVVLKDSDGFFPPYQAAPLMSHSFARKHPRAVKALDKLKGKVTTEQMQAMNYKVTVLHQKAADVAKEFLQQEHLI